jgi:hypothetical protein
MTTGTADQVVADSVEAAQVVFGSEIEAIYVLGSLAHGGFAPLVSDVDVAIVLGSTGPDTADRVASVQSLVAKKARGQLSERVSLFWADWHTVRTGEGDYQRLGPVDRLDLLDSGRLLLGSDLRETSVRPSREELVEMSADLILRKFTESYLEGLGDSEALVAGGPHRVTKTVLFPVRFAYTLGTGRIGLNDTSAHWYALQGMPGSALGLKALEWRNEGIGDSDRAVRALDADLITLHAECLADYARHLDALGDVTRAAALAERSACVNVAVPDTHRATYVLGN